MWYHWIEAHLAAVVDEVVYQVQVVVEWSVELTMVPVCQVKAKVSVVHSDVVTEEQHVGSRPLTVKVKARW